MIVTDPQIQDCLRILHKIHWDIDGLGHLSYCFAAGVVAGMLLQNNLTKLNEKQKVLLDIEIRKMGLDMGIILDD